MNNDGPTAWRRLDNYGATRRLGGGVAGRTPRLEKLARDAGVLRTRHGDRLVVLSAAAYAAVDARRAARFVRGIGAQHVARLTSRTVDQRQTGPTLRSPRRWR